MSTNYLVTPVFFGTNSGEPRFHARLLQLELCYPPPMSPPLLLAGQTPGPDMAPAIRRYPIPLSAQVRTTDFNPLQSNSRTVTSCELVGKFSQAEMTVF